MGTAGSRTSRRRIGWAVAAGLLLVPALAAVLLKATPAVYRRTAPMGPDEAAVDEFNEHVVNQVGNVLLDQSGSTPLDLEVTEAMVNGRLARFLADEAGAGKPVPPVLRDLRIGFEPGAVVVVTRVGRGAAAAVVSQYLRLSAETDGRLRVEPVGTRVGVMPLPAGAVDYARRAIAGQVDRRARAGADEKTLELWRAVLDALDGKPISLGKKKRIALDHVEVERGVLRMRGRRTVDPKT